MTLIAFGLHDGGGNESSFLGAASEMKSVEKECEFTAICVRIP
jgi:hypothetical protein